MILFRKKNCNSINHTPFVSGCFIMFLRRSHTKHSNLTFNLFFWGKSTTNISLRLEINFLAFLVLCWRVFSEISLPARHDMSLLSNNIKQLTGSRSTDQQRQYFSVCWTKLFLKVFHQDERIVYMLIVIDVVNVCINHVMMETISLSIRVK